jgi:hypothetical protein
MDPGRYKPGLGKGTKQYYHNSDSGVGSFSDQDNFSANPDRVYAAQDYPEQYSSPADVREALKEANSRCNKLKLKYKELEADYNLKVRELATRNKEYADLYGKWQGRGLRADVLEDDKKRLSAEKKTLVKKNEDLAKENENLAASNRLLDKENRDLVRENDFFAEEIEQLRELVHSASSSPEMSGALQDDSGKPRRRDSKKAKDEKQKARLSRRFDNDKANDTRRSRRLSTPVYSEPFGPPAPRSTSTAPPRYPSRVAVSSIS